MTEQEKRDEDELMPPALTAAMRVVPTDHMPLDTAPEVIKKEP